MVAVAAALAIGCVGQSTASVPSRGVADPAATEANAKVSAAPTSNSLNAGDEIVPVSRSNPSADATAALNLCGVDRIGIDRVAKMGEIPRARDASKYVPLWGVEPEIQTDAPAWLIVFSGKISTGHGYWAENPVCAVIDGAPTMFTPGTYGRGEKVETPPTPPIKPTATLPDLAP